MSSDLITCRTISRGPRARLERGRSPGQPPCCSCESLPISVLTSLEEFTVAANVELAWMVKRPLWDRYHFFQALLLVRQLTVVS